MNVCGRLLTESWDFGVTGLPPVMSLIVGVSESWDFNHKVHVRGLF